MFEEILKKMKKQKDNNYKVVSNDGILSIEMDELSYKLLTGTLKEDKNLRDNK